jgi:hypothetical protein
MKPLNSDNPGCTPVSSDCVIWQGADIECINLCKGDTVSKVVEKLANELCEVLDMLNVDSYDLSCLDLGDCTPKNFEALLQLLIEKICALEGLDPANPTTGGAGCPDCVVNIASCFYFDNPQGDRETTMQLTDYVTTIGNELCRLIGSIGTIDSSLANQGMRIAALEKEVSELPDNALPMVQPVCVLPPDLVPLEEMAVALEAEFCALRSATGTPQEIYEALVLQCAGLNDSPQLNRGAATMSDLPEWNDTITNFADGFANMLLTVCDMRDAIRSIQNSCCTTTSCDELDIEVQGVITDPDTLTLYFTGTFPVGYAETNPSGSVITITDALGNSMTAIVQITANLNQASGYSIDLSTAPINPSTNLIITVPLSYTDGENSLCEKVITDVVINEAVCPTVNLIPAETTIDYSMSYLGTAGSVKVILYDATGTVEISNQTTVVTGPQSVSGQFTGLNPATTYKVQLEITITGAPSPTICPFGSTTTTGPLCIPPVVTSVTLNIP